ALALNLAMLHASLIGGPGLAGLLLASGGHAAATVPVGAAAGAVTRATAASLPTIGLIYATNACSFLAVILALVAMRTDTRPEASAAGDEHPLESLKAG